MTALPIDDHRLAARDALYRRLTAAHAGSTCIDVMREEETVIVTLDDPRWRGFLGFHGYVELVHDDSPAQSFDVFDGAMGEIDWYHRQLLESPVAYAQSLLDESGLQRQRAEEERMAKTLAAITRRQAFAAAREMAAAKWRRQPNWVFAKEIFGIGSTYAHAICAEMGVDPDATTATRFPERRAA